MLALVCNRYTTRMGSSATHSLSLCLFLFPLPKSVERCSAWIVGRAPPRVRAIHPSLTESLASSAAVSPGRLRPPFSVQINAVVHCALSKFAIERSSRILRAADTPVCCPFTFGEAVRAFQLTVSAVNRAVPPVTPHKV
ncbi:hypothetical protein EVAR_90136_1 [Eumeta japonica]|uniref:Uncharacterized protein n=1 Tax=Eumeta variegata TaxID=151549 RepID=A0A4C2A2L0_EUMVA|nr:hypothetical protein EVAR_90136_1 [Eumeta japonica]